MKEPHWINFREVLVLHDIQLVAFGGPPGIRDAGLLESALARPLNIYAYHGDSVDLITLAAAYAFGIIKNHPFIDGNKRTGLIVSFTFLELNGVEVTASEEDVYRVFMDLASGTMRETALIRWFKQNTTHAK